MWTATITRPTVDKQGNPSSERVTVKLGGPYASVSEAFADAQRRFNWDGSKVHAVAGANEKSNEEKADG